jgi:type IX secretion system PorP/SprF family membrane protein
MIRKNKLFFYSLLICSLTLIPSSIYSQQVQFSQYMFNGLILNPAYAGADESLSLTFYNRSQWSKVEGAPTTQTLSAHALFKNQQVGAGFALINDKIGVHQNFNASASGAYHLRVSSSAFLSMGLKAGINHRESDYQSLGPNVYQDPKVGATTISQNLIDLGAGLYFRSNHFHLGFSAPRLIPGKMIINDTITVKLKDSQYFIFSKFRMALSPGISFEPGFLLKYLAGVPLSYDLNTNFVIHKVLITGISYRNKESIDFLVRAQVTPQLQLGYGYDHVIGNVTALSQASHELMVNYQFKFTRNNITPPR